jgi:hypothetical protein
LVIRLSRATKFLAICAMVALTALISIGTRSISVSSPFAPTRTEPLPLLYYRDVAAEGQGTTLPLWELEADLDYFAGHGILPLSERDVVSMLRLERDFPAYPALLLFDENAPAFQEQVRSLLESRGIPWISLEKSEELTRELRAAGYVMTRLERVAGVPLDAYQILGCR